MFMRTGRVAAVLGSLLSLFAALPAAPHPPLRVAPERSNGANIPSGGGGNIPGRTLRDSGVGCGECHGAKAYGGNTPAVTISGPSTLNAGSTGSFAIKTV